MLDRLHQELLATGHKKAKLRAHSDMCWNTACNDWALSFASEFDIMVEAKKKICNISTTIRPNTDKIFLIAQIIV